MIECLDISVENGAGRLFLKRIIPRIEKINYEGKMIVGFYDGESSSEEAEKVRAVSDITIRLTTDNYMRGIFGVEDERTFVGAVYDRATGREFRFDAKQIPEYIQSQINFQQGLKNNSYSIQNANDRKH